MQAATEGDDERVSWALARGGDPRNPESDGDVVLEDMRQQGAQTLSPVARAALSRNLTGGTLCVRRLAQLADCCFNFVVMWRFVNQSVGATNRALAKREYVSLDVADEIRDTAVEVLRGVRARVSA